MSRRVPLVLAALVVVAVALRLPGFGDALFGDELSTFFIVDGHGLGTVLDLVDSPQEQTPPLIFLLAWGTSHLGYDSMWLRVPSLLAGVATIPLVYALGKATVGRRAGLLAAAFATLSPFLLFYATEARAYALATFLDLLSTYALVRALEAGARRRWWVLYAAAACLAMYTHYTAGFVLIAQAVWALAAHRDRWKPLILASAVAALGWLPWLPVYLATSDSPGARVIDVLRPFGLRSALTDVLRMLSAGPFSAFSSLPGRPALVLLALGAVLAVVAGGLGLRRDRRPAVGAGGLGLLLACAVAAPVIGALASTLGPSVFLARNVMTALPYAALVVAALLVAADRRAAVAGAVLVAVGLGVGAAKSQQHEFRRADVDGAVRAIAAMGQPGDPVLLTQYPFGEPGVLQRFDVALRDARLQDRFPVIRYGLPAAAADRERRERGPGQFVPIPIAPVDEVAAQAERAARRGTIFVVDSSQTAQPSDAGAGRLQRPSPGNQLGGLLDALPGYRIVAVRRFPGLLRTDVLTLRRR